MEKGAPGTQANHRARTRRHCAVPDEILSTMRATQNASGTQAVSESKQIDRSRGLPTARARKEHTGRTKASARSSPIPHCCGLVRIPKCGKGAECRLYDYWGDSAFDSHSLSYPVTSCDTSCPPPQNSRDSAPYSSAPPSHSSRRFTGTTSPPGRELVTELALRTSIGRRHTYVPRLARLGVSWPALLLSCRAVKLPGKTCLYLAPLMCNATGTACPFDWRYVSCVRVRAVVQTRRGVTYSHVCVLFTASWDSRTAHVSISRFPLLQTEACHLASFRFQRVLAVTLCKHARLSQIGKHEAFLSTGYRLTES
jgi:hypothetical protein